MKFAVKVKAFEALTRLVQWFVSAGIFALLWGQAHFVAAKIHRESSKYQALTLRGRSIVALFDCHSERSEARTKSKNP